MTRSIFICYALEGERLSDLRARIELITWGASDAGVRTYAHIRDAQCWQPGGEPIKKILDTAFRQIREADAVFLDLTSTRGSKRVGLNIEAGYAKALGKPILALYHESERPNMTTDLADFSSPYRHQNDIRGVACGLIRRIDEPKVDSTTHGEERIYGRIL